MKRTNVTLESPDNRRRDLGTWEVVRLGPDEVQGNNPDVGWVVLARFDHEAEGWRTAENGELFDDLYVVADQSESGSASPAILATLTLALVPVGMTLWFVAALAGALSGAVA